MAGGAVRLADQQLIIWDTRQFIWDRLNFAKHNSGQLLASDMMFGDVVDARKEPSGWKLSSYDDSNWKPVQVVRVISAATERGYNARRISSRSVPVREKERFIPRIFKDAANSTVLDFGQNIVGYVDMKLRNTAPGQKIRLIHGENIDVEGIFHIESISDTSVHLGDKFQEITYICKGTKYKDSKDADAVSEDAYEEYKPIFSVFGFRYVKLEGYYDESDIQTGDFTAM